MEQAFSSDAAYFFIPAAFLHKLWGSQFWLPHCRRTLVILFAVDHYRDRLGREPARLAISASDRRAALTAVALGNRSATSETSDEKPVTEKPVTEKPVTGYVFPVFLGIACWPRRSRAQAFSELQLRQ